MALSYLSSFDGGQDDLHFGAGMRVTAAFGLVIYFFALSRRLPDAAARERLRSGADKAEDFGRLAGTSRQSVIELGAQPGGRWPARCGRRKPSCATVHLRGGQKPWKSKWAAAKLDAAALLPRRADRIYETERDPACWLAMTGGRNDARIRSVAWRAGRPGGIVLWIAPRPTLIEFPADDPERARRFWSELLETPLTERGEGEGTGWQSHGAGPSVGVHARGRGPGDSFSLPYFAVAEMDAALARVRELGGAVIHPGTQWSVCRDSEGSPFALALSPE
ncbi:MAG: VOC family protein [Solirubrobacteraceae bacterium]